MLIEKLMGFPVALGIEGKVGGPNGLAFGYRGDEVVLGHGGEGIVGPPLLAERRAGLAGQLLPARGAGPVRGEDPGLVR